MTHEDIENKRNRLIQIVNMSSGTDNVRCNELRKLALEVGASHKSIYGISNAKEAELVVGIQNALQTASMLETCRIATENCDIAQKATKAAICHYYIAAGIAILAMIAAWVAVFIK